MLICLLLQYVGGIIAFNVLALIWKTAILLQYLRIFVPEGTRGFTFWASHVTLWANAMYYITILFIKIFACKPIRFFWDKTIPHGHCIDQYRMNVIGAVICLASDVTILLLPQRVILSLTLSFKRKLGLALVFAIGIL